MQRLLCLCVLVLGGCDLYFTGDDDYCAAVDLAYYELRNPEDGSCVGQPGQCIDSCGPCPLSGAAEPAPDWGMCYSTGCEQLRENECEAADQCRVIYDRDSAGAIGFFGCWAVAPSGPAAPGGCSGLNAYQCSRHNDCIALYDSLASPRLEFIQCLDEKSGGTCGGAQCAPGTHCEDRCDSLPDGTTNCRSTCVPDDMSCNLACPPNSECVQVCGPDPNGASCDTCHPECRPVGACETIADVAACSARSDCDAIYQGYNCTCHEDGTCMCESLIYDHCVTK